jgi:hypothetical protein
METMLIITVVAWFVAGIDLMIAANKAAKSAEFSEVH